MPGSLKILHNHTRLMSSIKTCVLKCRPESIRFKAGQQPEIEDAETEKALNIAAQHLKAEVSPIVFPTETVYGLGASALNTNAVAQIFATKRRPADNPLIVHVSSLDMLNRLLPKNFHIPPIYLLLMRKFWPGALSLLFPSDPDILPSIVTANHSTMAIRMPSSPVARALIAISDLPLAAPSANSSGLPSPTKVDHVLRDLNGRISYILDGGPCTIGLESTVVDGLTHPQVLSILRPGGVTAEDIENCIQSSGSEECQNVIVRVHSRDYQDLQLEEAPTTPGMKYRHYSPQVPVVLLMKTCPPKGAKCEEFEDVIRALFQTNRPVKTTLALGLLMAEDSTHATPPQLPSVTWELYSLGRLEDKTMMASRLFDGLIELEGRGVDYILAESIEETQIGLAFMNRLMKAATEIRWLR